MAQRHGIVDDLQLLHHALGNVHAGLMGLECHHAGEILHLGLGKCMLRVGGKPRIEHPLDGRMAFKTRGKLHGRVLMRLHAERQRCRAAHDEPGIERRQHAAEMHRRFQIEGIKIGLAADDGAAHRIAMAADIFGQRMDHEIRAKAQGLCGDGCCIG